MARYVDGFVVPVPKKNLDAYRRLARLASKVWREHGALEYVESVADDVKPGKWTSYKSRAHRDRVIAKAMKDPRLAPTMDPKAMPFDGRRMIYGGFASMVWL